MRIGIDLGGTKIEGIVLDHGGNELLRERGYESSFRVTHPTGVRLD